MNIRWLNILALLLTAGCGTSKWTDTGRSATEQLLITDAMDRAVSELDFRALAGKTAYIDSTALKRITDSEYLVSCMRQHMLASGCIVKDNRAEADYIVEVRAGAVGTDRHDVLYGVPAVNIPTMVPVSGFGIPPQVPEMPIIKKTDQRAVVKLSVFAYNQKTGRPIWQSGAIPQESDAKAVWVLGAGPFQRGTIFNGMEFAGDKIDIPLVDVYQPRTDNVSVADEAYFTEPDNQIEPEEQVEVSVAANEEGVADEPAPESGKERDNSVLSTGHAEPSTEVKTPTASSPPPTSPHQPDKTQKPPDAMPDATSQKSALFPPNDLAPALTAFPFGAASGLPRESDSIPGPLPIHTRYDGLTVPVPELTLPDRVRSQP